MFIQTETGATAREMRFFPGKAVTGGAAVRLDAETAARAPLAEALFAIEGIEGVTLEAEAVLVTKIEASEWQILKPAILGAIMEHFMSGAPVFTDGADAPVEDEEDAEIVAEVQELIESRIRPAARQDGGDVTLNSFRGGIVYLDFQGRAEALLGGITNMLRHYVPEVRMVRDAKDLEERPGLDTDEARTIQRLLDERINPAVAAHGGRISLVDVQDDTAYIRLEGGCHGCGMADATLKQGVEVEILRSVPSIRRVLDATDHASGANPYYAP